VMQRFILKTALLCALLGCAVLYGMETAKQGMIDMRGLNSPQAEKTSFHFNIPGLADRGAPSADGKTSAKAEDNIEARVQKLDEIQRFNPFSIAGEKIGDGLSGIFRHGIQAAASLFNAIVNAF